MPGGRISFFAARGPPLVCSMNWRAVLTRRTAYATLPRFFCGSGEEALIDTSDFRNGMSIVMDGDIYTIVEFQHVKPGKGGAFVRTRLKNLKTAATLEKTFRAGEKMEQAILERKPMNYPYSSDGEHYFMDMESYEQVGLPAGVLGDS